MNDSRSRNGAISRRRFLQISAGLAGSAFVLTAAGGDALAAPTYVGLGSEKHTKPGPDSRSVSRTIARSLQASGQQVILPTNELTDWSTRISHDANVTFGVDRSVSHTGNASMRITNSSPFSANVYGTVWQKVSTKPNTTYDFNVWVKGQSAKGLYFTATPSWSPRHQAPNGTYDWTKLSFRYTTGADETSVNFRLVSEDLQQSVWIDDASMTVAGSDQNLLLNPGLEGQTVLPFSRLVDELGAGDYAPLFLTDGVPLDGSFSSLEKWNEYAGIKLPSRDAQVQINGYGGDSDLSAEVHFAYDADNFYLEAMVEDNVHSALSGSSMWQADSIQLAFGDASGAYGPEYGLANVNGQPEVWRWNNGSAALGTDAVKLATSRSGNNTLYEAQFPWKAIYESAPKPGDKLLFTMLVNDNDGSGRKGWIEWEPGIGSQKSTTQMATLELLPQGSTWAAWLRGGERSIIAGDQVTFSLYVLNEYDSNHSFTFSLNDDNETTVSVPARSVFRQDFAVLFSDPGKQQVTASVKDSQSEQTRDSTWEVTVVHSPEYLNSEFDRIESNLPALLALLKQCKARGIPTDYETVSYTVIRNFVDYGRDDVQHDYLSRAEYVADQLERLYQEAKRDLEAYLDGTKSPFIAPRYVTGNTGIRDYSFVADRAIPPGGRVRRGTTFFTGYGHFGQVRQDVPQFHDYGTNVIQIEIGPNSVIVQPDALPGWSTSISGGANAKFAPDDSVSHAGKASLHIVNSSPRSPNVYGTMWQTLSVKPDTTYDFSVWVKGENSKGISFTVTSDWVERFGPPSGTFDWTEVKWQHTTGASETQLTFRLISEDTTDGTWIDDASVIEAGSDQNLLKNPGFEETPQQSNGWFNISTSVIENDIRKVLANAEQHDVAVNLLLSPHYFPGWILDKYPELRIDNNNFLSYDINNPIAREVLKAFLQTIIPMIKDYRSLQSLTLSNEPTYMDSRTSKYTQRMWHGYLSKLYGTVGKLNSTYGSDYASFEDVPVPAPEVRPTSYFYDWATFNNQQFAAWHKWMADIIHDIAPDIPVQAKIMSGALRQQDELTWGVNPEQFAELSQINGDDNYNYLGNGPSGFLGELAFYDLQRSMKAAPIFNSEDHIIPDRDNRYVPEQAQHVRTTLWQGAIHGRGGSTIWVWERTYDQSSDFAGSVLTRPDVVDAVGRTNLDLNRLADEVTTFQSTRTGTAILYSIPADVYSQDYLKALNDAYAALSLSGQKVDFISEKQISEGKLKRYKLLVVPNATHVLASTLDGVRKFAQTGGTVVLIGEGSMRYDEHDRELPSGPRGYVLQRAAKLSADLTSAQLRAEILKVLRKSKLNQVMLIDTKTGQPAENVEWRTATYEGRWLINVANYALEPRQVEILVNGNPIAQADELIAGQKLSGNKLALEALSPYMLSIKRSDLGRSAKRS